MVVLEHEVNVPVFELKGDALPTFKNIKFFLFFNWHRYQILPQHPEPRSLSTIYEANDVVYVTAGAWFLNPEELIIVKEIELSANQMVIHLSLDNRVFIVGSVQVLTFLDWLSVVKVDVVILYTYVRFEGAPVLHFFFKGVVEFLALNFVVFKIELDIIQSHFTNTFLVILEILVLHLMFKQNWNPRRRTLKVT